MTTIRFAFFLLLMLVKISVVSQNERDSLYLLIKQESNLKKKAIIHSNLANSFLYENRDSARHHYFKSIDLYDKEQNQLFTGSVYKNIGMSFIFDNKLDSGIYYMEKSLTIYQALHDTLNTAYIYNNLGLLHINIDDNQKGVEYLILALRYKEGLINKHPIEKLDLGGTQLNIGIAFQNLYDLEKAVDYYHRAMESYVLQKDSKGVSRAKMQLANGYYEQKRLKKAEELYRELIIDSLFTSNLTAKTKLYNNFGALLSDKKEYKEAIQILNDAYKLNIANENIRSAVKNLNNIAFIYYRLGNRKKVIEVAEKALGMADECGSPPLKITALDLLSDTYDQLGNKTKAIHYFKQLSELKDTVYDIEKNRVITEIETKYSSEKKQQQIEFLNAQQRIQELEIRQKTDLNRWITIGLILLSSILVILIFTIRKIQKQKRLLDKQNVQLAELNSGLHKMFAIVTHDIRNFINGFKSVGSLLAFYIRTDKREKLNSLSDKLALNSERLDELLDNLLNWAVAQSGLYKPKKTAINLFEIVNSQINLVKDLAEVKGVKIVNRISAKQVIHFDYDNLNFIIRNLLSNAIKYTKEGVITFSFKKQGETGELIVEDTGVGLENDKLQTIFTYQKNSSEKGTDGEKGSGLGLKLVNDFVTLNNAKIKAESKLGKGTRFIIVLN